LAPEDFEVHLRHRARPDVCAGAVLPLPPSVDEAREVCEWRAAIAYERNGSEPARRTRQTRLASPSLQARNKFSSTF